MLILDVAVILQIAKANPCRPRSRGFLISRILANSPFWGFGRARCLWVAARRRTSFPPSRWRCFFSDFMSKLFNLESFLPSLLVTITLGYFYLESLGGVAITQFRSHHWYFYSQTTCFYRAMVTDSKTLQRHESQKGRHAIISEPAIYCETPLMDPEPFLFDTLLQCGGFDDAPFCGIDETISSPGVQVVYPVFANAYEAALWPARDSPYSKPGDNNITSLLSESYSPSPLSNLSASDRYTGSCSDSSGTRWSTPTTFSSNTTLSTPTSNSDIPNWRPTTPLPDSNKPTLPCEYPACGKTFTKIWQYK